MSQSFKNLLALAALFLLPLLAVAAFVYFVFFDTPNEEVEAGVVATQFLQYQATAERYQSRLLDYAGMCDDIGLPPEVACQATDTEYRISQPLTNGTIYCMDTTGFRGTVTTQPRGLTCPAPGN